MKSTLLCAAAAALAFTAPASAGVVFEIETTDHAQSRTVNTSVVAEGRYLKMSSVPDKKVRSAPPSTMIFDAETRQLMIIEDHSKTYSVLDEAAIDAMAERVRAMKHAAGDLTSQMENVLDKVPEEQRAAMKEMMEKSMAKAQKAPAEPPALPTTKIKKTGKKMKQHGFQTARYDVYKEDARITELWVADWNQIEGGKEVAALFREMAEFMKEMTTKLSRDTGGPGSMSNGGVFEHMMELDGFPVVSRVLDGDTVTNESTLRSAKRQAFDEADFMPPSGYKKRSLIDANAPEDDHSGHDHSGHGHDHE